MMGPGWKRWTPGFKYGSIVGIYVQFLGCNLVLEGLCVKRGVEDERGQDIQNNACFILFETRGIYGSVNITYIGDGF